MRPNLILVCTLFCGMYRTSLGGIKKIGPEHQLPIAEDRKWKWSDFDILDKFTKWGPFGYFNLYTDPTNAMGPEILKGFGIPYAAYNGYNGVTPAPVEAPKETTGSYGYGQQQQPPPQMPAYPGPPAPTAPMPGYPQPLSRLSPRYYPQNPNPFRPPQSYPAAGGNYYA